MSAVDNIYQRRWRQGTSPSALKTKARQLARGRALERLAKLHPQDFEAIKAEERAKVDAE